MYGDGDIALDDTSEEVLARLNELAHTLSSSAKWLSSPVPRALKTAMAIKTLQDNQAEIEIAHDFAEQRFGDFVDQKHADLANLADFQAYKNDAINTSPPNGESFRTCYERVGVGMRGLAEKHVSGEFIIASHGGVLRAALGNALDMDMLVALKSITISPLAHLTVVYQNDRWNFTGLTQGIMSGPLTHPALL